MFHMSFSNSFQIWKYCFKKWTYWPSEAPFLKNHPIFKFFLRKIFQTYVLYPFSQVLFKFRYIFKKICVLASGDPFLTKNYFVFGKEYSKMCDTCFTCVFSISFKICPFLEKPSNFRGCVTCFICISSNSFQIWTYFKNNIFWASWAPQIFFRKIFQGVWQMLYIHFFKLFSNLKIVFKKIIFCASGALFLKTQNFRFF